MTSEVGFDNFVTIVELLELDFVKVAVVEFDEIRNFLPMEVRDSLAGPGSDFITVCGFHFALELLIIIAIIFLDIQKHI